MTIYRDQLEAVYRLIEKPENWQKELYADDLLTPKCFCLAGAFRHINEADGVQLDHDATDLEFSFALGLAPGEARHPFELVFEFNDSHTHPEVLALLQSAINRAPVREVTP